jgi:hypothetical protein
MDSITGTNSCTLFHWVRDPVIVLSMITHGHSHICFHALLQIPKNYALWKFLDGFCYLYETSSMPVLTLRQNPKHNWIHVTIFIHFSDKHNFTNIIPNFLHYSYSWMKGPLPQQGKAPYWIHIYEAVKLMWTHYLQAQCGYTSTWLFLGGGMLFWLEAGTSLARLHYSLPASVQMAWKKPASVI